MDKLCLVSTVWQDQRRNKAFILPSTSKEEDRMHTQVNKAMRRVQASEALVQRLMLELRLLLMASKEHISISNNRNNSLLSNSSRLQEVHHPDHLHFIRIMATDQSRLLLTIMSSLIMLLDQFHLHQLNNTALGLYRLLLLKCHISKHTASRHLCRTHHLASLSHSKRKADLLHCISSNRDQALQQA